MNTETRSRKLTIDDISDVRAYERERDQLREHIIELRRVRRVALGTIVSVSFESRDTIRYQIQEMARAERLASDEAIQEELDTYNPMVPEAGQLCATLFIELTSEDAMREWLGKLVGIEQSLVFRLRDGDEVRCRVEAGHESQLTREHVTAAVHYVTFQFTPAQVAAFQGDVTLAIDHPAYLEQSLLSPATVDELRKDLLGQ